MTRLNGSNGGRNRPPGYPPRPVARNEEAATELRKRTLTNLYNARSQWLADAHAALDATVAAAYGWDAKIGEEKAPGALLELNCQTIIQLEGQIRYTFYKLMVRFPVSAHMEELPVNGASEILR